MTKEIVRKSLIEQLEAQGKTSEFYVDMIDDYMEHWEIKEMLQDDIRVNGLRIEVRNGNGITSTKPNESVQNFQKETALMLKILSELKLKDVISTNAAGDGDYF